MGDYLWWAIIWFFQNKLISMIFRIMAQGALTAGPGIQSSYKATFLRGCVANKSGHSDLCTLNVLVQEYLIHYSLYVGLKNLFSLDLKKT
jgi:hypothetical protein